MFAELNDLFFGNEILSGLGQWITSASLIFARIVSFAHMAPVFSNKSVFSLARIAIALILSFIFFDIHPDIKIPEEGYFLPYVLFLNVAIGHLVGYISRLLFSIVTAGGEMMDSSMGFSSAQIFDPGSGSQTTLIGRFMTTLAIVIFFMVKGPERMIAGLYKSFEIFPLYGADISFEIDRIISLTGDIITMGFIIISPVVLTILLNDLILGLISRASPQINAFQISFTIKPSLGSIVLILILPLFLTGMMNLFTSGSRYFYTGPMP